MSVLDQATVQEWTESSRRVRFPEQSALDTQSGGDHYKQFKIQPFEYISKNNMGFAQGNIIKYASRYL